MFGDLDEGNVDGVRFGLKALQQALLPASGTAKRAGKGGVQYRALFMLDSVLRADNLKSVSDTSAGPGDETNLIRTVVSQCCP